MLAYALHFKEKDNNKIKYDDENNSKVIEDPRHIIEFFLEKLSKNLENYYKLGKNIIINKSLLHFTGRNNMKYYIPMT